MMASTTVLVALCLVALVSRHIMAAPTVPRPIQSFPTQRKLLSPPKDIYIEDCKVKGKATESVICEKDSDKPFAMCCHAKGSTGYWPDGTTPMPECTNGTPVLNNALKAGFCTSILKYDKADDTVACCSYS